MPNTFLLRYLVTLPLFGLFKFEEMNSELEENQELADNRLIELQKLQQDLQNVHQENNNMKVHLCVCSIMNTTPTINWSASLLCNIKPNIIFLII